MVAFDDEEDSSPMHHGRNLYRRFEHGSVSPSNGYKSPSRNINHVSDVTVDTTVDITAEEEEYHCNNHNSKESPDHESKSFLLLNLTASPILVERESYDKDEEDQEEYDSGDQTFGYGCSDDDDGAYLLRETKSRGTQPFRLLVILLNHSLVPDSKLRLCDVELLDVNGVKLLKFFLVTVACIYVIHAVAHCMVRLLSLLCPRPLPLPHLVEILPTVGI
jgi:hypothetical protein